ncbi:Serine/threonine-protein kinase dkf-1 [Folsomia candida]|uniref:non-specific serine/threonine protein kinase n=2 Tax=Folsomia candida TaxID=158441 RepID=A0A226D7G7_FOLCA|nr:Serine/threonine-protein kinase dkf-1 [Folsomia candida]
MVIDGPGTVVDRIKLKLPFSVIASTRNSTSNDTEAEGWPSLEGRKFPNIYDLDYKGCLGGGSFGLVVHAIDRSDDYSCAMKFIFPPEIFVSNGPDWKSIMRECKIAIELEPHPNLVRSFGVVMRRISVEEYNTIFPSNFMTSEETRRLRAIHLDRVDRVEKIPAICITMEICGENLRQWLNETQDAPQIRHQQLVIIRNMVSGLKYLHDRRIRHCDLKPENVLFTNEEYNLPVKIGDFGLSRITNSFEVTTTASDFGTREYMAPETLGTKTYYDQSDLFSLGLVIWEVAQLIKFNKRRKFFDRLVNDQKVGLIKLHTEIEDVRELIIGLTKRDMAERVQSITDVAQVVEKWKLT